MTTSVDDLTCREFVELVTDYLEEALEPAERRRFDEHLVDCLGCTAYLAQMRETIRLTGRLREEDVDGEAMAPLLNAFRYWKQARSRPPTASLLEPDL